MNDQIEQPIPPAITAEGVNELLNGSDVISMKLEREGRAWSCVVRSLRAAGAGSATCALQAITDAVVKHNAEWQKVIDG